MNEEREDATVAQPSTGKEQEGELPEFGNDQDDAEVDAASEKVTGSETARSTADEGNPENCDALSEGSDLEWDTDLETEVEKEEYDPTGKKDYLQMCQSLKIVPVSHFIRCLVEQDAVVDLSHHCVGARGAKAIAAALTSNTFVTSLNLSDNGLGPEGAVAIDEMLKENCYITHIDLSENRLGPAGALALAEMLTSNSTITHCYLKGNQLDAKAAEPISEIIKTSYHITVMDLSHNEFSEVGGVLLGAALAESEVLQVLDLSWNHLRRKGAVAIAQGLKSNQMLKVLNLAYNGFGQDGAVALADAFKMNSTLTELDITENRIPPEGAIALAKVIPNCEGLKVLKLGRNPILMHGVTALLSALKAGSNSIKHLGLHGITVTLEIAKIISEMEADTPGLTIVHGGTGGYKEAKPRPSPLQKLTKYATENNVRLKDLFHVFDKQKVGHLVEEDFRASLKHISAPLMNFEIIKLLKEFGKKDGEGEEAAISVDYGLLIEASTKC